MDHLLTRTDVLREEALVRARETCGTLAKPEDVVAAAEKFYSFLTQGVVEER